MAIRKVILTERELTRLIKRIVIETKHEEEMEEGWLGDKLSDMKKGGRKFFTGYETGEEAESKKEDIMNQLDSIEDEIESDIDDDDSIDDDEKRRLKRNLKKYVRAAKEEAKDDNYRGRLRKSGDTVIYVSKPSGFRQAASSASGEAKIRK